MRSTWLLLALLTSACGSAAPLKPGTWSVTAQIQGEKAPPDTVIRLSAAQAVHPRPADLGTGADIGVDTCQQSKWSVEDGRIAGEFVCQRTPGGAKMLLKIAGSYSPESFEYRSTAFLGGLPMVGTVTGRRTGD